jgi:hypothetical protein
MCLRCQVQVMKVNKVSRVKYVYYDQPRDRWLVRKRNEAGCACLCQFNGWVLATSSPRYRCAQQATKVFYTKQAAEQCARQSYSAAAAVGKGKQLLEVIKSLVDVYGTGHQSLVPADLADAVCRHTADMDILREEPGAELISMQLKYGPVRAAFGFALRKSRRRPREKAARCKRIYVALVHTAREMSKPFYLDVLSLWSSHWGRHVTHHSGWLPFMQRGPLSRALKTSHNATSKRTHTHTLSTGSCCAKAWGS